MVDAEFDEFLQSGTLAPDSSVRRFYEKLADLPTSWICLEDQFYRNIEMGDLTLGQMTKVFSEWPHLNYFHYTQAKNGGPIGKHFFTTNSITSSIDEKRCLACGLVNAETQSLHI